MSANSSKLNFVFTTFIGIIVILISINKAGADCNSSTLLPNLPKRSRTYQADGVRGSDPYVSDNYLFPGWYSVVFQGEQWLMPDINSAPKFNSCGTVQPIYLQEPHPDISSLTDTPLALVACELFPFDPCLNTYDIFVRMCGDHVQYYLKGTGANSAFCFDPPALQNLTDFIADAPTVQLGELMVSPDLRWFNDIGNKFVPYLVFECVETGGVDKTGLTLTYTTYWYIDDKLQFTFENDNGLSPLSEDSLLSKEISLGIQVRCGAKLAKSVTGLKSGLSTSANFFAGVNISENRIIMSKDEQRTIYFLPTIPYGCYGDASQTTGSCTIKIEMVVPYPNICTLDDTNVGGLNPITYHSNIQARCGLEIFGCYSNESSCTKSMQEFSMNITTPFFSNDDPDIYRFKLVAQNAGAHKIWRGYDIDEIVVNIKKDNKFKSKVCFSHVDPHMQTADGKHYDNNDFNGQFILYWNTRYNIMVQERTTSCNSNSAFCTCAVAVRAGGDIFLINLCNDLKFIGMTSCEDNGALVIEKYDDFAYEVQTNIGTLIKIRIRPHAGYDELMNIDIVMAPKDYEAIKGLCGTFDSNFNNEFHDRNGNSLKDQLQFINEWKLKENDENYLLPTCKPNVTTWEEDGQQLFCHCNCYESGSCPTVKTEAVCSPSQFINCTVPLKATENLCKEFTDKCQKSKRKRRSSFTVDPEKEMQRRAALAETRRLVRKKRQSDEQDKLSIEEVREICTDGITSSTAVEKYSNLLEGYNYSAIIEHCVFDVYEGQDKSWLEAHKMAMNDAVKVGFKRNANYTEVHRDVLVDFKKQYCPSDCQGNGNCTDKGVCSCTKGYFGPDCGNKITEAPEIEDIEGGGICDTRTGSECKCFDVQVNALAGVFYCRRKTQMVYWNGSSLATNVLEVDGLYKNFFTGECCFESQIVKRSLDVNSDVAFYEFKVSLSNDGSNFGQVVTLHIFDSLCQDIITDDNGQTTVQLKVNTCLINGNCYEENDVELDNECFKCLPGETQLNWTNVCKTTQTSDDNNVGLIVGCTVAAFIIIVLVSLVCVVFTKKKKRSTRTIQQSQEFTFIREQSKLYFDPQSITTGRNEF